MQVGKLVLGECLGGEKVKGAGFGSSRIVFSTGRL